jgi:hypothetical protein
VVLWLSEAIQGGAARTTEVVRARFDRIFKRSSRNYAMLDGLLRRLFATGRVAARP